MAKQSNSNVIVKCPRCQGRGKLFDPHAQEQDPDCPMCAGRGKISTKICMCGRPVIWIIADLAHCNHIDCFVSVAKMLELRNKK
jgi:hypothetical protein